MVTIYYCCNAGPKLLLSSDLLTRGNKNMILYASTLSTLLASPGWSPSSLINYVVVVRQHDTKHIIMLKHPIIKVRDSREKYMPQVVRQNCTPRAWWGEVLHVFAWYAWISSSCWSSCLLFYYYTRNFTWWLHFQLFSPVYFNMVLRRNP